MESRIAQSVSATQLVRDLAGIRTLVADGPVGVTSHGRTELVILNAHRFSEMSETSALPEAEGLEAKLSIVLDTIDTRVVILDHDLKVRRINRAMRIALQLPDEQYLGSEVLSLLAPAIAPFLAQRLAEVRSSGRVVEFDFVSPRYPERTIHARMMPWPGGIAYFSDDITERLRGIEQSMEFDALRAAFSAAGDRGTGSVGPDGTIFNADAGLAKMIGAEADQLNGRRFVSLFDRSARSQIEAAIDWRETKASVFSIDYLRSGVDIGQARLSLAPYFSRDGRPRFAFCLEELRGA